MLWRKMVLVAIVFYSIAAPYAYAQRSFEVTPPSVPTSLRQV